MSATTGRAGARPAAADGSAAWALGFVRALQRDAPFHGSVAACLATAAVLEACCARGELPGLAWQYGTTWAGLLLQLGEMVVAAKVAWVLLRDRPRRPLRHACQAAAQVLTPETVAGLVLFEVLALFMAAFTAVKMLLPALNPFWCDPMLAQVDRALHGGQDAWTLLQPLLRSHAAVRAVEFCYGPVWMGVVTLCTLFFCALCPDGRLRRRFLSAFLLAWVVNGAVVAGAFMSGGPAFHDMLVEGVPRFAALRRSLAFDAGPLSAATEQAMLWQMHRMEQPGIGAGISAFPSLHVTMAMLCALAAWAVHRGAGLIGFGFVLIIMAGSVRLGWHYAVDGYAAAAGMAALWWAVGRMAGAERRR